MTKGTVKWFNDQKGFGFIPAAIIRLNEAEAFLVIEPLHGSFCHIALLSGTCGMRPHVSGADLFEIWREVVSPDAGCAAGQVVRPKLDCCYMAIFRWTARLPGKSVDKRLAI